MRNFPQTFVCIMIRISQRFVACPFILTITFYAKCFMHFILAWNKKMTD